MKATTTTTRIRTRSHRSERRRKRKFQKKDKQKENDLTRCVRRLPAAHKERASLCKVVKELLEREEEVVGRLLEAKNDNGNSGGLTISADLYDACIEDLLRG